MADDAKDDAPKMGIGERIMNIANNFLQGMAHSGRGSVYTGKGAMSQWAPPKDGDPAKEVNPDQQEHSHPEQSPPSPEKTMDWER